MVAKQESGEKRSEENEIKITKSSKKRVKKIWSRHSSQIKRAKQENSESVNSRIAVTLIPKKVPKDNITITIYTLIYDNKIIIRK